MALKIRRGLEIERTAGGGVVFAEGELVYVTDTGALFIGDGLTPGGILVGDANLGLISAYLGVDTLDQQLDLNADLNLNGKDIVGTGNINITGTVTATGSINIGDNVTEDTVTLLAKVNSNITPKEDSQYDLGTTEKRWQNVYATGLVVDGQIDAVSIKANTIADNSTVMVDVDTNTFTGNLTGDVTGNVSGNVEGNLVGDSEGYHTGDVKGSVFGDDSTQLVDAVAGVLRGDHYGSLYGSVKALNNGFTVLNPGTDGLDASFVGDLTGNVSGNVTGDVQGNVVGNTTGFHTGDIKGSVFGDDSVVLVDAVAGVIPGSVISGTVTANLIGNVSGEVTGNVFTSLIDSADSSTIQIVPTVNLNSDLIVDNTIEVRNLLIIGEGGPDTSAGPQSPNVIIDSAGIVRTDTIVVGLISTGGLGNQEILVDSNIGFELDASIGGTALFRGDIIALQLPAEDKSIRFTTFTGDLNNEGETSDPANFNEHLTISRSKFDSNIPIKFPNFTTVERDALTAEVGMVIFNTTDTKLQVCTVGGGTPTWVDLH
jgi:hypothetical protein